jgi:hypothetical protein
VRNLRIRRSSALLVALLTLTALIVPVAGPALANHPSNTCLDVEPDDDENPVGSNHVMVAKLRSTAPSTTTGPVATCEGTGQGTPSGDATNSGASGVNIDFEITGVNDPDASDSPATPDRTCTIFPGTASCSVEYQGFVVGDDTIRAWIDHDGRDASQGGQTEADLLEGQNSTAFPGSGCPGLGPQGQSTAPEPDCTDVVAKEWAPGAPAAVDCDDQNGPDTERETNPSLAGGNSNETYTCTVTDQDGNVVASDSDSDRNLSVFGEVENPVNDPDGPPQNQRAEGASYDSPDYRCMTDDTSTSQDGEDDGTCTIVVGQVDGEVGTAEICFWIEEQTAGSGDFLFASGENPDEGGNAAHCGGESTGEAQQQNGSDVGNDAADQTEKTWEGRRAASVDAEPESDTNQPGENHTITAFVYDQFGGQFSGSNTVHFEFFQGSAADGDGNTPASPDRSCTTQNSNQCSITYTSTRQGTDLVCVFLGSAPAMSGDNNSGTCDGEGLTDADDDPAGADPPEGTDDQDVVQKRWGTVGSATRLDCDPETDTNPTGTQHTVTCTARDAQNNVVGSANIDAEATGANDPDGADSPSAPDFTCNTNAGGQCSFIHGTGTTQGGTGSTSQTGTTTYRAWIDSDNVNTTVEADRSEGQAETTQGQGGTEAEPDNTDVVTKTWTQGAGPGRRIDCEPETATNPAGTNHVVTCTVTDARNAVVPGESVTFTETGPGTISPTTATTDANGRASTTATSSELGTQTITGTITNDTTGNEPNEVDECDRLANDPQGATAGECSDSVTKTWTEPKTQCSDGIDNDGDEWTDFPNDPGCESAQDNDEFNEPLVPSGPCGGRTQNTSTPIPGGSGNVIVGTDGDDVLTGTDGNDIICGLGGDDIINALGGKDQVVGNAGNDSISGRDGNDALDGGGGDDIIKGNAGVDTLRGRGGNDTLQGGDGEDTVTGGGANDVMRGWDQNDTLRGGAGRDTANGGKGRRDVCDAERQSACER